MIWVIVWVVLVAGTLVGAWFLVRDLWRKAKELIAELTRAAEVLGELADTTGRLAEDAREAERAAQAAADLLPDPGEARRTWHRRRQEGAARRAARRMRDEQTRRRWRQITR